jgi:CPA1 family monovalent cation:H+ antiporter
LVLILLVAAQRYRGTDSVPVADPDAPGGRSPDIRSRRTRRSPRPEIVLLVLLPPCSIPVASAELARFRSSLRPILLLAVGCVLFTAISVAVVLHELVHVPWTVGFVLGAIVSPPDVVAAVAFLRAIRLPRRVVTVLEGESLANDATALVILGFALQALTTGHFSLANATIACLPSRLARSRSALP